MGDVQFLPGYCLLLADPVLPSINDVSFEARTQFLHDMVRIGDALLEVTPAYRINDEILGNAEPELHAHIFPRLMSEAADSRRKPAWCYDRATAVGSSEVEHGAIRNAMRDLLRAGS